MHTNNIRVFDSVKIYYSFTHWKVSLMDLWSYSLSCYRDWKMVIHLSTWNDWCSKNYCSISYLLKTNPHPLRSNYVSVIGILSVWQSIFILSPKSSQLEQPLWRTVAAKCQYYWSILNSAPDTFLDNKSFNFYWFYPIWSLSCFLPFGIC